eukprot:3067149-Amphidinium_carterae.2
MEHKLKHPNSLNSKQQPCKLARNNERAQLLLNTKPTMGLIQDTKWPNNRRLQIKRGKDKTSHIHQVSAERMSHSFLFVRLPCIQNVVLEQ